MPPIDVFVSEKPPATPKKPDRALFWPGTSRRYTLGEERIATTPKRRAAVEYCRQNPKIARGEVAKRFLLTRAELSTSLRYLAPELLDPRGRKQRLSDLGPELKGGSAKFWKPAAPSEPSLERLHLSDLKAVHLDRGDGAAACPRAGKNPKLTTDKTAWNLCVHCRRVAGTLRSRDR